MSGPASMCMYMLLRMRVKAVFVGQRLQQGDAKREVSGSTLWCEMEQQNKIRTPSTPPARKADLQQG
eukprot:1155397-Pelagomonas_calceolata.AAC.7